MVSQQFFDTHIDQNNYLNEFKSFCYVFYLCLEISSLIYTPPNLPIFVSLKILLPDYKEFLINGPPKYLGIPNCFHLDISFLILNAVRISIFKK